MSIKEYAAWLAGYAAAGGSDISEIESAKDLYINRSNGRALYNSRYDDTPHYRGESNYSNTLQFRDH